MIDNLTSIQKVKQEINLLINNSQSILKKMKSTMSKKILKKYHFKISIGEILTMTKSFRQINLAFLKSNLNKNNCLKSKNQTGL